MGIEDLLSDFTVAETQSEARLSDGGTVTIWLLPEDKARYDRLQQMSKRKFGRKARQILLAAIDQAEKQLAEKAG
jgi:hypothetical protein